MEGERVANLTLYFSDLSCEVGSVRPGSSYSVSILAVNLIKGTSVPVVVLNITSSIISGVHASA